LRIRLTDPGSSIPFVYLLLKSLETRNYLVKPRRLFEFGSFAAPVAILASALLSSSGVFMALLITRTTFNVSSLMGMIMVIGIVAKNGILLLDADQKFRGLGRSAEQAMLEARAGGWVRL
jgi:hypothetical protein